jgi:hypothetical protein
MEVQLTQGWQFMASDMHVHDLVLLHSVLMHGTT